MLWRVLAAEKADAPLEGDEGAGRWNPPGTRVVYTSTSFSLALLEALVHASGSLPAELVTVRIEAPEDLAVEAVDPQALPRAWRATPPPADLAARGGAWAASRRTPLLLVPSAVAPTERNVVVNLEHPDASRLRVVGRERYVCDRRLCRGVEADR